MPKATIAPPLFQLIWKLGVKIPPPLFMGFASAALMMGALFGIFFGALMWFLFWRHVMPLSFAAVLSAGAGVMFGVLMALYLRWKARQLCLPAWHAYALKGS